MKKVLALLAIALLTVGLAGCGDSDDDATTAEAPEESSAPAPDETTDEEAMDEGPVLEVIAADYSYEGLPDTVTAGTRIALSNSSETELHEFVAIPLAADEERSVEELLQLPPEELGALFPNVTNVILAAPGSSEAIVAVGSDILETPGRYAIICAIPTGADPNEYLTAAAESEEGPPEVEGGPPHFVNGMWAEITVE